MPELVNPDLLGRTPHTFVGARAATVALVGVAMVVVRPGDSLSTIARRTRGSTMTPSISVRLVNPWDLVAGDRAPGELAAPPAGVVAGVAGGVVVACAYVMAPATTSPPHVALSATAPPALTSQAVVAEPPPPPPPPPPPRRVVARAPGTQLLVARRAPVGRRAPEARKGIRMLDARVTAGFGKRHGAMHWGLDLAAPIGTPIHVPLDGTVVSAGPARGFGRWVRIRHADGTVTVYGHVNRALVTVGERVRAGDVIAEVGNRGQSTGAHLHIEVVRPGGRKVDPRRWLDEQAVGYRAR